MNIKSIILFALFTITASVLRSEGSFSQIGCTTSYTGPLHHSQINLSYKCFTPTVRGSCYGFYPSYHYNPKMQKCEKVIFGDRDDGCQAFTTQQECEESCVRASIGSVDPSGMASFIQAQCEVERPNEINKYDHLLTKCFVKTKSGKCYMNIKSYHFDIKDEKGVESIFGGCDDGCRAFQSIEECQNECYRSTIAA